MGVGTICVSKLNYRSSGTVTPAQVFAERSETVNCCQHFSFGVTHTHQASVTLADIFTFHWPFVTSLCKHVSFCLHVPGMMLDNNWPTVTPLVISVVTKLFSGHAEDRRTQQMDRECESVTLIISLRCDSGSRPAMGRILIFCVLEQRSARDRVIFLWVALSVEWGLETQKTTNVTFMVAWLTVCRLWV